MQTIWINGPFGVKFFINVDDDGIVNLLNLMQSRLKDVTPLFQKTAKRMRRSFGDNFRQGGRPDKWVPLTTGTIDNKKQNPSAVYGNLHGRMRYPKYKQVQNGIARRSVSNILILTGALRDSYVERGANHIETISNDELVIGSSIPYAPYHEFGTGTHGVSGQSFTVRPIRARSLRFFGANGAAIFRKSVQNPGVPARPACFFQESDIKGIVEDSFDHVMEDTP